MNSLDVPEKQISKELSSNFDEKYTENRIVASIELVTLLCMPLMGFRGQPLTYEAHFDEERPYCRELALRIMKGIDPKRACNNLLSFETTVVTWLNINDKMLG